MNDDRTPLPPGIAPEDIRELVEAGKELKGLAVRRDELSKRIETRSARQKRSAEVAVNTALMAGTLVGASVTLWLAPFTLVGMAMWVRSIKKDAEVENAQLQIGRDLQNLKLDVDRAEARYRRIEAKILPRLPPP